MKFKMFFTAITIIVIMISVLPSTAQTRHTMAWPFRVSVASDSGLKTAGDTIMVNTGTNSSPRWQKIYPQHTGSIGTGQAIIPDTIDGSNSGKAIFVEPFQGTYNKRVIIRCIALDGDARYVFPKKFLYAPDYWNDSHITAIDDSSVTVTDTTGTRWLFLDGY